MNFNQNRPFHLSLLISINFLIFVLLYGMCRISYRISQLSGQYSARFIDDIPIWLFVLFFLTVIAEFWIFRKQTQNK